VGTAIVQFNTGYFTNDSGSSVGTPQNLKREPRSTGNLEQEFCRGISKNAKLLKAKVFASLAF
jgi:hypothetical protein